MAEKKYFITGGNGRLASELRPFLNCVAPSKEEVNILSLEQLDSAIKNSKPNVIIHLAAISNQKLADEKRAESYSVNVIGTRNVASIAKKYGLKIFYVSTDYVFEGTGGNYAEESAPKPANWYGYTKYAGELEVQQAADNFCIIRTSFRPKNWGFPSAYSNVYTSADYIHVIAKEILLCLGYDLKGIIHIGTPTKTFYELAKRENPDIKSEVCTDENFPKRRDLNISRWLSIKEKMGANKIEPSKGNKIKVLVTGGSGFIGKHVMELLEKNGFEGISLSRRDGFDMMNLSSICEHLKEQKPRCIINCAAHTGSLHYVAKYAADVLHENVQMILNLYRAVKEIDPTIKIINPVSNCSYPGRASIQKESQFWDGPVHESVWSYGNSRRTLLMTSKCYSAQYGIKTVNFFVPNTFGPGDSTDPQKTHALNGIIIRMLEAKAKGKPAFEIWGTGKPSREWAFVKDVARILVDAINIEEQVEPVNLAQNKSYTIAETAEMVKQRIGYKGDLVFNTNYQDGDPIKQLDDNLFKSKFPLFKFTEFKKGLDETIAYYEKELGGKK